MALSTRATVDQAVGLLGASKDDPKLAAYGCELIGRGWTYTDARAVVHFLAATGMPAPGVPAVHTVKQTRPARQSVWRRVFEALIRGEVG